MTPTERLVALAKLFAPVFAIAACQAPPPSPRTQAAAAASQSCRAEVDRVYAAQNRADLSTRDQRDAPFAANYLPGVTTQGLGARYGRDNMMGDCLDNVGVGRTPPARSASPAATGSNPGPTFSPVAR